MEINFVNKDWLIWFYSISIIVGYLILFIIIYIKYI